MHSRLKILTACIILGLIPACYSALGETSAQKEDLTTVINYLLAFVENSDCTFIRHNKAHTAKEAVAHIQKKYDYFKNKIKTPEDFIRLAASKSMLSGSPYMVRTKAGKLIKSKTWLLEALADYRIRRRRGP